MLEPWYLPGLQRPRAWRKGRTVAGAEFRVPELAAGEAVAVASGVRQAVLEAREHRTTDQVIDAVAAAATRLAEGGAEGRAARKLLRKELGWDERLVAETLAGMSRSWSVGALQSLVESEVGDSAVLDGFAADPTWRGVGRRMRHATGSVVILQVLAGNVPGVSVTATVRALLARSGVLCKLPEAEPGLLPLFAHGLATVDPLLGRTMAATWWPGGESTAPWGQWIREAGRVVVYGGAAAVRGVRESLDPGKELVVYGPRVGIGVVLPGADAEAPALARDVCSYEQQGCVSPRLVYVVGGPAETFARRLAEALEAETRERPAPDPTPAEAVAIRATRATYEFGAYGGADKAVRASPRDLSWTVLSCETPGTELDALPRVVRVYSVADMASLAQLLKPLTGQVQSLGYAGTEGVDELAGLAATLEVSRVAPFGTLAWPPADWRHEGRHQLLPLLSWTDFEKPV